MFPHSDGKQADSYIAKLVRIAAVRVKSCGVVVRALSGAVWLLHQPLLPLPSGTWVVSLSVATSFHTTSVGGTVSRLYMCKSVNAAHYCLLSATNQTETNRSAVMSSCLA